MAFKDGKYYWSRIRKRQEIAAGLNPFLLRVYRHANELHDKQVILFKTNV